MPTFKINDKEMKIYIERGRKRYGIFLYEKPNKWYKVGSFHNDETAWYFIDYLNKMFEEVRKENEQR